MADIDGVRAAVASTKCSRISGGVEAADVAAEGEELDAAFARFDVAVEAVGADVVGRDQVPTPCWRV